MDIYSKKVKRFEINTVGELETFIKDNNVKKHFIKFPTESRELIQTHIDSISKINLKNLKTDFLKKYFTVGSCMNVTYWLERGYSILEAETYISDEQTKRARKFHKIRKQNPTEYDGYNPTQKSYWIKRGYTENEAIEIISKRQSTFSKEKLVDKFGEKVALEHLNRRNQKWFDSLKKNNDWNELSLKKGRNGLNQIKTLSRHIEYYGELVGRIKFAKRYWGVDIGSIDEFKEYERFLSRERTTLFYDKHYREIILNEQDCKCAECHISNTDASFHLHHIDYNKLNDERNNLIFLCHSCHSKTTNSNRDKWINYYTLKNKKYYDKKI